MRKTNLALFIVVMTCGVMHGTGKLKIPRIPLTKYFEPQQYGGGIQNWDFAQASNGLLYIANNHGILEFDGRVWTLLEVPGSTKIRSIYIDDDQRIFAGGQGQIGYFENNPDGLQFRSIVEKLPENERTLSEVWKIFKIGNVLFFDSPNKLLVLDGDEFYAAGLPGTLIKAFNVEDSLVVQIKDEGLFKYINGSFSPLKGSEQLQQELRAIISTQSGFACFAVSGEVFIFNETKHSLTEINVRELQSSTINTCKKLSNSTIAVGTQNRGLIILDENLSLINQFSLGTGLNNRTVHALMEDTFGNLWVGLNNGINYIELNSPLSVIDEHVGLEGTGYAVAAHENKAYLGTNNGLFTYSSSDTGMKYKLISGSEGQVYNISIIGSDIIVNHHKGAFQLINDQLIKIHDQGSWKFMKTAMPDRVIAGHYTGIKFFEKDGNLWTPSNEVQGINESSRIMEFENDSTIWMTHGYKGAFRISFDSEMIKTKNVEFFGKEHGFPSNLLINVYRLDQNLIFTAENGIYKFNEINKSFEPNQFLIDHIGENHVSKINSTNNGDIYYLVDRQLGYLKRESFGTFRKNEHVFKRVNKFLSDDLENISILDKNNILIGAKEGFIHFDPELQHELIHDFDVILKRLEVKFTNDSSIVISGQYAKDIQFDRINSIKFIYASPYFDGFEDIVFSHRLIGFDDSWSAWTTSTVKEYTNLPAGKFTFELKAKNVYEHESNILSNTFQIIPRWYESKLALSIFVLFTLVVFGLITFVQSKRHRKEKEAIHLSKDAEISQVSRRSRAEIENLKNEKLMSEIKHKNNELASITMHLLNKNEFVHSVRKRIESVINDSGQSKDELKKILKTIDKNLKDDDSWDQFAYHFDQVHGDFLKKLSSEEIKLTSQETKLAAYLRMNMTSKEIAYLMNISVRGVELGRYRLRKKLNLQRDQNLTDYLLNI